MPEPNPEVMALIRQLLSQGEDEDEIFNVVAQYYRQHKISLDARKLVDLIRSQQPYQPPEDRYILVSPLQLLTIDNQQDYYQIAMPSVGWNNLNPSEMVNQLVARQVDKEGRPFVDTKGNPFVDAAGNIIGDWIPLDKNVMAAAGMNAREIRHEIIYNTMRQELLDRGVDPLVLNMPDVEKFIVEQSVTQRPGVQSNYIDQLIQKLGQVGQDPIQGGAIMKDFGKQLKAQSGQFEQIQKLALGQFPEPRNLDEAKQFAEEKSRRVQDMVARGQMESGQAVLERNNIERELEEWNRKFQGISQNLALATQRAQGLQNFYAGAPTNAPSEREYRLAQVEYFQPLVEEWRKTFEAPGYDLRTADVGQQVAYAGYDAYNRAVQRLEAIGAGGEQEPGFGEEPEPVIQKPFEPFKNLLKEARKRQRRVAI